MMSKEIEQELKKPFEPEDLEWRIQQSGKSKDGRPWALVLTYVTARAIMDRLDAVVGPGNWQNTIKREGDAVISGIAIRMASDTETVWVWKYDGAQDTQVEAVKGGISSALKRAAVLWGIGRYLYKLPATFAKCYADPKQGEHKAYLKDKSPFSWDNPPLPKWALPDGYEIPAQRPKSSPQSTQKSGHTEILKAEEIAEATPKREDSPTTRPPYPTESSVDAFTSLLNEASKKEKIEFTELELSALLKKAMEKKGLKTLDAVKAGIIDDGTFGKFWEAFKAVLKIAHKE